MNTLSEPAQVWLSYDGEVICVWQKKQTVHMADMTHYMDDIKYTMNLAGQRQTFRAKFASFTDELDIAALNGDTVTITRLHQTIYKDVVLSDLWRENNFIRLHAAVAGGHVAVLQLLKEQEIIGDNYGFEIILDPLEDISTIVCAAVVFEQIIVLDWVVSNFQDLNHHPGRLNGILFCMKNLVVLQWAFDRNLFRDTDWLLCEDEELLKWFARRLPVKKFMGHVGDFRLAHYKLHSRLTSDERKKLWTDVRRESVLATVAAGKRRGIRLPPEL